MVKNIIIVNDSAYVNGGADKVALMSAKGLSKMGYNVILFTAHGPIDPSLEANNVIVICLNQYDILSDPNRLRAVYQGLWNRIAYVRFVELLSGLDSNNTIVHFHTWTKSLSSSLFAAVRKLHFNVVITLHDYFTVCPNGGLFNYQSEKICHLKPISLDCWQCNCDVRSYSHKIWRCLRHLIQYKQLIQSKNISFITISQTIYSETLGLLHKIPGKWFHVKNPIELNENEPVPLNDNDTYLFIGRLASEKGCELFCQAITDLGLKGCVLGDGALRNVLENKYPQIHFAGWVTGEEKEVLIRKGKALVFPSLWYEGAPLTVLEIQSYGIPCIVPDKCAASEVIINEETGYIFQIGNIDSLKKAIIKYENEINKESLQYRILKSFDKNEYSLKSHCEKLLRVYNQIL